MLEQDRRGRVFQQVANKEVHLIIFLIGWKIR